MKFIRNLVSYGLVLMFSAPALSQQIKLNRVFQGRDMGIRSINSIAQDPEGYTWIGTGGAGVYRYNGIITTPYQHDSLTENSLSSNQVSCLIADKSGIIWAGTFMKGLNRFDPATKTFTHYRYESKNPSGISSDTVFNLLEDRSGNLWIGTMAGLDMLDRKTGKFIHYVYNGNDPSSISSNAVTLIYEDSQGTLWVGCGIPEGAGVYNHDPEDGGLNKMDKKNGKFTRYKNVPGDNSSLFRNKISALFEDSKGNFWVGTTGDGLHMMNRTTGKFTRFPHDPVHPEKLSGLSLNTGEFEKYNGITLIHEDKSGGIWIGGLLEGANRYDPVSGKITHYGDIRKGTETIQRDSVTGFDDPNNNTLYCKYISKDGELMMGTLDGNIYKVTTENNTISYNLIDSYSNSFYEDKENNLWIAAGNGLIKRNRKTNTDKIFRHEPRNPNSLPHNDVVILRADENENLWIGFNEDVGLVKYDIKNNKFTRYTHHPGDTSSIAGNKIYTMHIDKSKKIWLSIQGTGVDKMDMETGKIVHYTYNNKENPDYDYIHHLLNYINTITEDANGNTWLGGVGGVVMINGKTDSLVFYLNKREVISLCVDSANDIWMGTTESFFRFDKSKNQFSPFAITGSSVKIKEVLDITQDNEQNLWLTTEFNFIKLNKERNKLNVYGKEYGIRQNNSYFCDNYKSKNGEVFVGDQSGYYSFYPSKLKEASPPSVSFAGFKLGDEEIMPSASGVLQYPLWQTKEIKLKHNQDIFSFDFSAIDYSNTEEIRYSFMLENYDNDWRDIGTEHKAYFFHVPPGDYIFRVKAINSFGRSDEKTINIIITPPWWRTWWAYTLFALLFVAVVSGIVAYRSAKLRSENKILEEKVSHRTEQLKQSLENLKATQTQLIQSEKMASLGELTAGIAHEIQNPLNFVNNFSEVNNELLQEMKAEIDKGNFNEVKIIAQDVIDNGVKINHHGKRADGIVKGMLQHSRTSTGQKELTDINRLTDEYLRLSYHGIRAKEKNFNATIHTDFDNSIGKINIIPQDMGRVLLNLYNNAFYTVNEKKKVTGDTYEPTIAVTTKKEGNKIIISVKDNGNGIPQNIVDKIFQPFFTTKPTGKGTGLGLSLSYDIVKTHGGELKVETKDGEYAEFIIIL